MILFKIALWLSVVAGLGEAGLLHFRQAPTTTTCSPVTIWQTFFIVETVTEAPGTVTILQQDPSSVANSMASIDTLQILQSSLLAPISNSKNTELPVFTHSVRVSGYEATELPHDGSSVFYMSKGPSTTDWSYTPSASIVAEVTTVTVSPIPARSTAQRDFSFNHTTGRIPFTSPSAGWNYTSTDTSAVRPTGTGSLGIPTGSTLSPLNPDSTSGGLYTTETLTIITASTEYVTVTAAPSISVIDPASTEGYVAPASNGYDSPVEIFDYANPVKRQTCVLISATIGGHLASWCNNWDGQSVLTYTSWETTVTATPAYQPEPETTSSQSAYPSPTASCGESGPFVVDFEDLPVFSTTDNATTDFPPIFNPYRHFFWGAGWSFVPPPQDPFPPHSGSRLAQVIQASPFNHTGSPNAGLLEPNAFGCGPRNYNSNYWFNARSAWVGCDDNSTNAGDTCDFVATGYQWDNVTRTERVAVTQHFTIPPCPGFKNCHLRQISFNYQFYRLSKLSFYANINGLLKDYWIDDINLSWFNNTCEAGLIRISSRK